MAKSMIRGRLTIRVKQEHHQLLKQRRATTGVKLEALIDEALEAGFRVKRWLPSRDVVEAA